MKEIKLAIFPGHFLPHTGGLETHVDELVKYLSRKNYKITIFTPNTENAKSDEVIHRKVRVIRYPAFFLIPNFPFPKFWKKEFYKQYKKLKEENPEIVMTRTRFFINSFMGLLYAKFRFKKKKLLHVEHGSDYVKLESKLKSFIAKIYDWTLGWSMFLFSDKVIAISEAVLSFCKKFTRKEIPIIRRGVDFEIYNEEKDRDIERKYRGKRKILFLGRLYNWKGVANGVEAYKKLNEKDKSVYIIAGDGEDKERLKELAKGENIEFLGRVSFERAIKLLNTADIYLHSAYPGGGLSNSLLQAMYCKNLIVASPHEGAREVVDENKGILLKDNNVEEIKKGLEEALAYKGKTKQNKARKYIEENFSWEQKAEEYDVEIRKLVS